MIGHSRQTAKPAAAGERAVHTAQDFCDTQSRWDRIQAPESEALTIHVFKFDCSVSTSNSS